MSSLDLDKQVLLQILTTPDEYKKGSKVYKQAISLGDVRAVLAFTELIQKILANPYQQKPMVVLNGLRFIKETFERKNEIDIHSELICERILPQLVKCALFAKDRTDEDRGKYFFSENPSNELAIIGNSFFRLTLECIIVWAGWFPNTVYSQQFDFLLKQGVTFPQELNYYKDEDIQQQSALSQRRYQEKISQDQFKSQNRNQKSVLQGINLNTQKVNEFSMILVQILMQFQKVKESFRVSLVQSFQSNDIDTFNSHAALIQQYGEDFKILVEKGLTFETSVAFEKRLNSLFNESEFVENFLIDAAGFRLGHYSFQDLRSKYINVIKPLENYLEKNAQREQRSQNQEEEKSQNEKNNLNKETPTHSGEPNSSSGANRSKEVSFQHKFSGQQNISQRRQEEESMMNSESELVSQQQHPTRVSNFKQAIDISGSEKYKQQMRSGSNFRKQYSTSPANMSNYSASNSSMLRSAIIKKQGSTQENSFQGSFMRSLEKNEILSLKKQIEEMQADVQNWKNKFESITNELEQIKAKKKKL